MQRSTAVIVKSLCKNAWSGTCEHSSVVDLPFSRSSIESGEGVCEGKPLFSSRIQKLECRECGGAHDIVRRSGIPRLGSGIPSRA